MEVKGIIRMCRDGSQGNHQTMSDSLKKKKRGDC